MLVTGATGALGSALVEALNRAGHRTIPVARRPVPGCASWDIGVEPPPATLDLRAPTVVHAAASTRWTMTPEEATASNVRPLDQLLGLIDDEAHLVLISTAYAARLEGGPAQPWRNEYERSKAECEQLALARTGPSSIVRPPLILGSEHDGSIGRFSGTYGLMQLLTSGLLAAIVGDAEAQIPIVPATFVADAVVESVADPSESRIVNLGSRQQSTMAEFVRAAVAGVNRYRQEHDTEPIDEPPIIEEDAWDRFHFPFSEDHLTHYHRRAIELMRIFGRYSTNPVDYVPDVSWDGSPRELVERSVVYWCRAHHAIALRQPRAWSARR